ncbi:MAG: amidase family protein [Hyphomicrobiaceae bacterium]|nr:amidase family protein [Hyphomicrobiaceae bacterium]
MSKAVTEPCDLSAVEARRLIGARKLSPVELLESCLKRTAATNGAINAVVASDEALGRRTATEMEADVMSGRPLGILHGLPVGVKDLEPVKGLRTTWGSLIFKDHVPEADGTNVANVREAGANIFAKTNTPEFGAGANTRNRVYGATGNPFDTVLTAAGSSGGSAAALAVGQMPLATGSDYGGSLRTPSSYCGIVGFRPSVGVVPSPDRAAGLVPWGVLGPMGRTVADAYLLFQAQVDENANDPYSTGTLDLPERLLPSDLASLRIAITPDFGQAPVAKNIRAVFADRMRRLASWAGVAEATHPDYSGLHDIFEVHRGIAFVTQHQDKLARHRDLLDRNVIDNTERGLQLTMADVGRGMVEQHKLMQRVNAFFEDWDVLIAPTASVSPFPHAQLFVEEIDGERMPTYMRWLALAYAPTMALCCACNVPTGRDDKGLPFGIQVIGPRGSDLRVLEVAAALEEAFASDPATARPVPDLARLAGKSKPA